MATTRSQKNIFLIGGTNDKITGARLPTNLQVLQVFFHFHSDLKLTVRDSSTKTIELVLPFWEKAGIPTRACQHVIAKLENLYQRWKNIQRNKSRRSGVQIKKEEEFTDFVQELFDIAHQDALQMMTLQEDKDFLIAQRDGGQGCMMGVDEKISRKEVRKQQEKERMQGRVRKAQAEKRRLEEVVEFASTSSSEDTVGGTDPSYTPTQSKRARKNAITTELASALDRCNISDRKAVYITAAAAAGLGQDVSELNINRSSIRRAREYYRCNLAKKLKENFEVDVPLTVHWDGKLLPDLTGKETVDRLPILVSGSGVHQLLAVPKLQNGTGALMAEAVSATLEDWGIKERICGMVFDTTPTNTGHKAGACVLLEQKMGRRLLSFACRHHMYELVLQKVFSLTLGVSSGPDIQIFKRFQNKWDLIDKSNFRTRLDDKEVKSKLSDAVKEEVLTFAQQQLEEALPREDYRELLNLAIIFLGGVPPGGVRFRAPAGLHSARWMARLLYGFKIFMFSRTKEENGLFKITATEENGLRELLCFAIAGGYIQAWFSAPVAASAPLNDLKFLVRLQKYSNINKTVADSAIKKFLQHLWYFNEEMIGLAFFDPSVSLDEKTAMQQALKEVEGTEDPPKRIKLQLSELRATRNLSTFVTQQTKRFFKALGLPMGFLVKNPEVWPQDSDYIAAQKIVKGLKVVNDTAERGVALIQEFNAHLTHNEEQKQFLFQVVSHHRKVCPDSKKSTVISALK